MSISKSHISLSDLTRGLQHSALSAAKMVDDQYLQKLYTFFEIDENGSLKAKSVSVNLEDRTIQVPLISLISPSSLSIDKMKISMDIKVSDMTLKEIDRSQIYNDLTEEEEEEEKEDIFTRILKKEMSQQGKITRSSIGIRMSGPKGDKTKDPLMHVEMEFISTQTPEGLMRIIEESNKVLTNAKPVQEGEED